MPELASARNFSVDSTPRHPRVEATVTDWMTQTLNIAQNLILFVA
jgi:hypothetical protein